jgi:hypothetical protein
MSFPFPYSKHLRHIILASQAYPSAVKSKTHIAHNFTGFCLYIIYTLWALCLFIFFRISSSPLAHYDMQIFEFAPFLKTKRLCSGHPYPATFVSSSITYFRLLLSVFSTLLKRQRLHLDVFRLHEFLQAVEQVGTQPGGEVGEFHQVATPAFVNLKGEAVVARIGD